MDIETQNTINDQLEKLPDAVRSAIAGVGLRERFMKIVRDRGLRIDQAGSAEDEMMLVLIGLEHPDKFVDNLIKNAHLERDVATNVAADINNDIFKGIRQLLVEMHEKDRLTDEMLQRPETQGASPVPTQTPLSANIPRTLGTDMTQAKMGGTFHLPPDTVAVKAPPSVATPIVLPKPSPAAPVKDGKYAAVDPYREPTN